MKLYKQYLKERENIELIEDDHGFATYRKLDNGDYYIIDIYIEPEFRRSGLARELSKKIKDIAIEDKATKLIGSVCISTNNVTVSMAAVIGDGFKFTHANGNMLWFSKDIGE